MGRDRMIAAFFDTSPPYIDELSRTVGEYFEDSLYFSLCFPLCSLFLCGDL